MESTARNEIHKGYTEEELSAAFKTVANPDDWKDQILAFMPGEAVMVVVAAIEFYTATIPKVTLDTEDMKYIVSSEGYRAGPAGDH